jgi:murein DD-endopeptidase MepM/ murein hydrolase activator NlpD
MMGGKTDLRRRTCLLAGLILALGLSTLPAQAGPEDRLLENQQRLGRIQDEIEQANQRQDALTAKIAALDAERAEQEQQVRGLEDRLGLLDGRIVEIRERLESTQARLGLVSKELKALERQLAILEEINVARAVATYKAGPTADLDALLSAETFGDLVDRYEYYAAALDEDARLIEEMDQVRAETERKQGEIEEARNVLATAKQQLESDRAELDLLRAEKASVLAAQEAVIQEKDGLLAAAEVREDKLQVARQRIEEDSNRIQALLQARAEGISTGPITGPLPSGGGQLAWPAAGSVTSPYGYRIHPIFGYSRLHTGVDIGAGYGAPVIASADGVVAYVGAMSGYGNVVVIDHGGGMATTYNHLSSFAVSSGESVRRGETIAAVGCTGWCTGPHLHFEVRLNGSPVDPMPYLS